MKLFAIDWHNTFAFTMSPVELMIRGTLTYLALFAMMRFVLKREGGNVGLADLLMTVMVADAAQNAMAAEYKSVTDGLVLVGTIVFWNYALDWLTFRFEGFRKLLEPAPLKLVVNGEMLRRNMRKELVSEGDIMSHARESGIESLQDIAAAYMESDGKISIIPKK
ncbi:MAG: DUF421 domain-containing protein [Bryobacteraceae bacterium]|nr:DUF421 domain-containing protein [Bryobacteraceae bacterium]